jgi:drug/metabolite transporter (DMT)-like permease
MAPEFNGADSSAKKPGGPAKFYGLLLVVILLKPFSNLFLAWGMRHFPEALATDPVQYVRAMIDPLVATGIAMQILWLLMRMALLGVADLSFVLPVTAVGYVLSTFLAHVFLHEQVSLMRWAGTCVIFLGTALVSFTARRKPAEGSAR